MEEKTIISKDLLVGLTEVIEVIAQANEQGDLPTIIRRREELKELVKVFANELEDTLMEIEELEREKWEEQEIINEFDYQQDFSRGVYNGLVK